MRCTRPRWSAFKENRRSPECKFIGWRFTRLNYTSEFIWPRTFLLFVSLYSSSAGNAHTHTHISDSFANSHLQIQNAVHHNPACADLHAPMKTGEDVCLQRTVYIDALLSYTVSTNIEVAAVTQINKRNRDNLFASRANTEATEGNTHTHTPTFRLYLPYKWKGVARGIRGGCWYQFSIS